MCTAPSSPEICRNLHHPGPHSPLACLPQSKLEHITMFLEGRRGESRPLLQGGGSAQKKGSWFHLFLRQQQKPAECRGLKGGLGWSHPSGRKSCAGMAVSFLRQLGELLDKPVDIVPGKYVWRHFGNLIS